MKRLGLLLIGAVLAGCASTSQYPVFINGHYYMAGDKDCHLHDVHKFQPLIKCFTSDGKETGVRAAMTDQQLQMWQTQQVIQAQQIAATNQRLMTPAPMVQYPVMQTPTVTPLPGSNQVRCIGTGIYTNCRY